jgi:hypothetical protein
VDDEYMESENPTENQDLFYGRFAMTKYNQRSNLRREIGRVL